MSFDKFRILLWKNWTVQKRHWKSGSFEIIFPLLLIILIIWIKSQFFKSFDGMPSRVESTEFSPWSCFLSTGVPNKIVYSPASPWVDDFVQNSLNKFDNLTVEAFANSQELDNYFDGTPSEKAFGVEFDDSLAGSADPPKILKYHLRFPSYSYYSWGGYLSTCFYNVQNALDLAFIESFGSTDIPEIRHRVFAYYESVTDSFLTLMKALLPWFFVLSAFYTASQITKSIALERESQLKETMRIMGLSNTVHWLAWFTTCFTILAIAFTLVTAFLKFKIIYSTAILEHSNVFLIWVYLLFYITAIITFCFLISVIFKKATTAGNVGTILFFLTYVIHFQFQTNFLGLNYSLKLLYCLPLNSCLGLGVHIILDLEQFNVGLQYSNIAKRHENYGFSVAEVLMMFAVISTIQLLLMIYIEQVFTGDIGVSKPWYFPFAPIVKMLRSKPAFSEDFVRPKMKTSAENFEADPVNMKAGIKILDMSKNFGHSTVVNQLSLNMYEDQITVLLGHNGAGKTTTMNMLIGMFSPTSGTAYLNGHDITTETIEARKQLGVCPQHNVLIDDLTVKEHIIFFCRLKGVKSNKEIDSEISKYVHLLEFQDKVNALSKTLSGGQKRKLSIGVALCGDSKIVMLDEPTSGLDAGARRALWNLLIEEKKGRTVLLTTHHMDEADVLADRIAIMNDGELQTVGSSYFLKKRFGSGYKFVIVKEQGCEVNEILSVLQKFAPDTSLDSNGQTEAVFIINEDYQPVFQSMFRKIEDDSRSLKISSFGCSLTTLEEVFIKVGSQVGSSDHKHQTSEFNDFVSTRKVQGVTLLFYQMYAIILKKFNYTRRNLYSIGWLTLLTAGFTYIFLAAPIQYDYFSETPVMMSDEVSLAAFNSTISIINHDGTNPEQAEIFEGLFSGKDRIERTDEDFEDYIFKIFKMSQDLVYQKYLINLSVSKDSITAWFVQYSRYNEYLASASLNILHRGILKSIAGADYDIVAYNKPFNSSLAVPETPTTTEEVTEESTTESTTTAELTSILLNVGNAGKADGDADDEEPVQTPEEELEFGAMITNFILIFLLFYLVLIYWPSIFIAIKVKERVTRSKLLQFISGANRFVYWFTSFVIDFIILLSIAFIIVGVVTLNQRAYFRTWEHIGPIMALFSCYGFATLPFVYSLSFLFEKHSTSETMVPVSGMIFGVLYIGYAIIKFGMEWNLFSDICYWILIFFGPFSLIDSFRKIAFAAFDDDHDNVFHFDKYGIGVNIVTMLGSGVLFMSFCLLKDHLIFERLIYKFINRSRSLPDKQNHFMDDDVKVEADKIKNMNRNELRNANLVLNGLSKSYKTNLAVNQLHLGVDNAECFGLLGINGAGKTSTFKMMTGDEIISSGDVWIRGNSMKNSMVAAQKTVGYCPQFDALMFDITGREILKIFSLIRGIPRNEIDDIVIKLATELGFHMHLDKNIDAYSGGNKRKLSTALSLLGDNNLIFLDEPTTGIDPYSKRQLWTIINKTRNSGKSVILTSHSMEECEALCTRIAIMVAGEFKCLGSAQHLKNKFSKGFILTIKMKHDDDAHLHEIQNRIHQMFRSAELKEKYMDLLTFHITSADLKWSEVFGKMTQMKASINDFNVSQMSLEQVFLHFSREGQHEVLTQGGNESRLI